MSQNNAEAHTSVNEAQEGIHVAPIDDTKSYIICSNMQTPESGIKVLCPVQINNFHFVQAEREKIMQSSTMYIY